MSDKDKTQNPSSAESLLSSPATNDPIPPDALSEDSRRQKPDLRAGIDDTCGTQDHNFGHYVGHFLIDVSNTLRVTNLTIRTPAEAQETVNKLLALRNKVQQHRKTAIALRKMLHQTVPVENQSGFVQ